MRNSPFIALLLICFLHVAQVFAQDTIWCDGYWKQAVMGWDIGKNTMNSVDIDNDGLIEIVAHASTFSDYWYVMEYVPTTGEYRQSWVSPSYKEGSVTCIAGFDLDGDGDQEIIVASGSIMEVWDGTTKTLQHKFKLPIPDGDYSTPSDMLMADANNDGIQNLVISTYSHIFIYDAQTLNFRGAWPYGGNNIACGNVDTNPDNELVISTGSLLRLNGDQLTLLWQFAESAYGFEWVGLIDCDDDGMMEIFYEPYHQLVCYDADLKLIKYQQEDALSSISYVIADTDNDGIMELLGAEYGQGYIRCLDPADGSEKWDFYNENGYVNALTVADADGDGLPDLVWSEDKNMHVLDIATLQEKWVSKNMEGLFAVRVADSDDDGQLEILTMSQTSDVGRSSGILTIWDEATREMEWQSDKFTFSSSLRDIIDFEVADIDNDGVTEIIVAGSIYNQAAIWVMNGQTHQIKSFHQFSNIGNFDAFTIADVDNDGNVEYLFLNGGVFAVNPADYSILWQAGHNTASRMVVGNVDGDPAKEIITYGWGDIQCIDGITHEVKTTSSEPYVPYASVALYDVDNNGEQELIAGTLYGKIGIIDGNTMNIKEWLPFDFGANLIAGLRAADLQGDGNPELVFFVNDALYFTNLSGQMKTFAKVGAYNSSGSLSQIEIIDDYDGDGHKEVFASSIFQVVEFNYDCYKCMNFFPLITGEDVSCLSDSDGSVSMQPTGGNPPYSYLWNNGSTASEITNLVPGSYSVIVTDSEGCQEVRDFSIIQSFLEAEAEVIPRGCADHYGQITIDVTIGHPPYSYVWNGVADSTATMSGLETGVYNVTVIDNKHCTQDFVSEVTQDVVHIELNVQPIICYSNGQILSEVTGYSPYSYLWSNGSDSPDLYGLDEGSYSLIVTDALACADTATGVIYDANNLTAVIITTPDTSPINGEFGTATIIPSGGVPPYSYLWQGSPCDSIITNLTTGYYNASALDVFNCYYNSSVFIANTLGIIDPLNPFAFNIYPNPAKEYAILEFERNAPSTGFAELYSVHGPLLKSIKLEGKRTTIPTAGLVQGVYFLKVFVGETIKIMKLVVE